MIIKISYFITLVELLMKNLFVAESLQNFKSINYEKILFVS